MDALDLGVPQRLLSLGRRERLGQQLLDARRAEAAPPPDERGGVTGQLMLEVEAPAEVLPVGVLDPLLDDRLVRLVEEVLEVVEPDQQARRQAGPADLFGVERAEVGLEALPVDGFG